MYLTLYLNTMCSTLKHLLKLFPSCYMTEFDTFLCAVERRAGKVFVLVVESRGCILLPGSLARRRHPGSLSQSRISTPLCHLHVVQEEIIRGISACHC